MCIQTSIASHKNLEFEVRHKVLVLLPTQHSKLTLQWRGQYMVEEFVNRMDYTVEVNHYDKKTKNHHFKVGHKMLVLLPTEQNKLTLQWRGPYMVEEVVNRMDYKVKVTKIYHANLFKKYFERDENIAGVAVQIDSYMAGVAVLDEEPEDREYLDDGSFLELRPLPGKESYINISKNLTDK